MPMYDYGYNGDKFKSAQVSYLETTKLKLSLKEKLELKFNSNNNGNKDSNNNRIFNKVNNDNKVTGIVNSGNKNITTGNNNKNKVVETVTIIDNRVKDLEVIYLGVIENERNLLREKFTEIIVVEIPETVAPVRSFDMEIKIIPDSKPIKRNYGRRSPEEFRLITEDAVRLFKLDIIEEKFAFPIPNVDDTLERTKNAKWFSKVDCKSGFHLLNLEEGRQYTAFRVENKLYQFKRCAFGLKNSPALYISKDGSVYYR
ncbi:hypothetical protein ACTA71_010230 [Dictyostelium dimigraforme]